MNQSELLLPGNPDFHKTLNLLNSGVGLIQSEAYIQRPGSLLLEPVSYEEAIRYAQSDEYDERIDELENQDDDWIDYDLDFYETYQ